MATNQLPQDMLIKILQYLPPQSIQACKLVSKEWKNLITDDPRLRYRLEYPCFAPFLFQDSIYCVSTKITNPVVKIISSRRFNNPPPLSVNRIPIECKDDDEVITQLLSESSKGIACVVTNHHRLFFYNLLTGASYPPTQSPELTGLLYGFGYDSFADDCKMMSVEDNNSSLFWVYSLRNRAWKSFEGFPHATYHPMKWDQSRCCSFNGVLHWLVAKRDESPPLDIVILTYDLRTCRFGEMLLPSHSSDFYGYESYDKKVAELGGCLCYYSRSYTEFLYVWTMREYGVRESWTIFLRIGLRKLRLDRFMYEIELTRLVYKCQSGRKLMLFVCKEYGTLYWYDVDNDCKVMTIQKNTWEKRMNRKRMREDRA